ncbi:COG4695 Phage-related protein [uncultured Caudovirales phage]|jgi:HK97 family phage portal protein|uniref:COG4695 Phage-related protein n=1 Tax=uncultured Caudovirales phage TaxID=2100421 RepID=A0A6J5LYT7_9CAUD|nr:COG4695 Phage-related protein [uncultured Caudovirales phage]
MATFLDRLLGRPERRAFQPTIPTRHPAIVNPDTALSLTAVYRAVQIIATPISKMTIDTYRFATGVELKIDNPVLVNNPSLEQNRRDFLFQTVSDLALEGNSYWFKNYGSNGQVNNLTILPASAVMPSWPRMTNGAIDYSQVVYDYMGTRYTNREIEHLRIFSRAGVIKGISPIASCFKDISAAIDLRDYAGNWFTSAGVPTGVLKTSSMINKAEAEEVTANWHNKQQNRQVAVLGNGFDYQQIALSPRDALFTEVQDQQVQAVARLFGVPARLLLTSVPGASDTYTNLQDENQVFYRHTLMAYTDAITDALSNCLPRGNRVEFDFEHLFKADVAARYNYYKVAIDAGILTPEEVRTKEGLNV